MRRCARDIAHLGFIDKGIVSKGKGDEESRAL